MRMPLGEAPVQVAVAAAVGFSVGVGLCEWRRWHSVAEAVRQQMAARLSWWQQEEGCEYTQRLVHKCDAQVTDVYDVDDSTILGRGAFGVVSIVKSRATQEPFAMKTVMLDGQPIEELRHEIGVHAGLDHPNIVRIFEYFEDPQGDRMHIIMELCTGGSLVERMKSHRHGHTRRFESGAFR